MRIHILGASGSGTTTLANALSEQLHMKHFDSDFYFWEETDPPFQKKREKSERLNLLNRDLKEHKDWVLSGSLCGWGDEVIHLFDLVIFLYLPPETRLERLRTREKERHGDLILEEGVMHQTYSDFITWAAKYDTADMSMRSLELHNHWLDKLECSVLRIEGDFDLKKKIEKIKSYMGR